MTTMHERFDEKFKVVIWEHRNSSTERFLGCEGGYCEMSPTEIKAFIQSEIDLAKNEAYMECVDFLDRTHKDCRLTSTCIGYQNAYSDLRNEFLPN